jgi:N-glycosylase/DNA lyase
MTELVLRADQPFNLDATLSCGQVFRWERSEGWWHGTVDDTPLRIRQEGSTLIYEGVGEAFIRSYFQLDLDLEMVLASVRKDKIIGDAIDRCGGLRIVRQPAWECLISYICATCSNIPMIRRRIANLAQEFGEEIIFQGRTQYTFPEPEVLSRLSASDLGMCRLGYRAEYIARAAQAIADDPDWAGRIVSLSYDDGRQELMNLRGVGPKAADCVLLFAFQKYESFPVDVWIRRIMQRHYVKEPDKKSFTCAEYDRIGQFGRAYFGKYAGYAQEYLYCTRQ